jgi:Alginate lyase
VTAADNELPRRGRPSKKRATIALMPIFRRRARTGVPMPAAALLVVLASCAGPSAPAPPAPAASVPPAVAAMLNGWQLTLPVPGAKGDAEVVDPADLSPPWLTVTGDDLVFWAPVNGVTTKTSEHARTELDRLENFTAGSGPQTLTASVTVAQVPTEVPAVIIGQIHGAGDISSVPFVMMFYDDGAVKAVVKQERSGDAHTDVPLLPSVPLGAAFDYSITDVGDGTITVTATYGGKTVSGSAPVPAAFAGASVRFQAGAYQQAPSAGNTAAPDDGARVTFSAVDVGTEAAPPSSP